MLKLEHPFSFNLLGSSILVTDCDSHRSVIYLIKKTALVGSHCRNKTPDPSAIGVYALIH